MARVLEIHEHARSLNGEPKQKAFSTKDGSKPMKRIGVLILITGASLSARAGLVLEGNALYSSHKNSSTGDNQGSQFVFGAFAGATFRKNFYIGVQYDRVTTTIDASDRGASVAGGSFGGRL